MDVRYHATKLSEELRAAEVPIDGCDSSGVVWFAPEATDADRAKAAEILKAHDYEACCRAEEQAKVDEEKIAAEMRRIAIERLQARGEIAADAK